jgi:hypothetical protein
MEAVDARLADGKVWLLSATVVALVLVIGTCVEPCESWPQAAVALASFELAYAPGVALATARPWPRTPDLVAGRLILLAVCAGAGFVLSIELDWIGLGMAACTGLLWGAGIRIWGRAA